MSWLDDRDVVYRYKCPDGELLHLKLHVKDEVPPSINHPDKPDVVAEYAGFEPEEVKQVDVVAYDKNGRRAFRIRNKDGSVTHISRSKALYMKTGRVEPRYTPEYEAHLRKNNQEMMLQAEQNLNRAKVKPYKGRKRKNEN